MRVLLLCKYKEGLPGHVAPFVLEQMQALQRTGVDCLMFQVKGRGVMGYLKQLRSLKKAIASFHPDVIHAHYGMCGLLANMQREVPVVTTYHGSDINNRKVLLLSKISMKCSAWNVFVSQKSIDKAKPRCRFSLLPCGVGLNELQLTNRCDARHQLGLSEEKHYVLFAGAFDNPVKDPALAREVVTSLDRSNVELVELKGYSREEVTLLMCAVDALLMTSRTEGSPQVVKEALACGCPIVSVDVGDVKERMEGVRGCYVAETRQVEDLAALLQKAMAYNGKTQGRERIVADGLSDLHVAGSLITIYSKVMK